MAAAAAVVDAREVGAAAVARHEAGLATASLPRAGALIVGDR
jgi:hypothetical protein